MQNETFTDKHGKTWRRIMAKAEDCWALGVDPGGGQDYTAVAAVHYQCEPLEDFAVNEAAGTLKQQVKRTYTVAGLRRLPLGLPHPRQVDEIIAIRSSRPELRGCDVTFDCTGLGAPVADVAEERGVRPLIRVIFSAGVEINGLARDKFSVPKLLLVSGVDAALHNGELIFPEGLAEKENLRTELQNFTRSVSDSGRTMLSHREGQNDDLVFAIALCVWQVRRHQDNRLQIGGLRGCY